MGRDGGGLQRASRQKKAEAVKLPKETKALKAKLEECAKELAEMEQLEQTDDSSQVDRLAAELILPQVLKSKDNTVRLLAGCCLADILHVYAPEPPYSNKEVKVVFEFLLERLRGLQQPETSSTYSRSYYIMKRLTECQSICLLNNVRDEPGDTIKTEDLVVNFIEAIFDVMTADRKDSVERFGAELIVSLFEDMESFSPRLLDSFLCRLLPARAKESPNACALSRLVIKQLVYQLEKPIATLLKTFIADGNALSSLAEPTEHKKSKKRRTSKGKRTSLSSLEDSSEEEEGEDLSSEESISDEDSDEESEAGVALTNSHDSELTELKDHLHDLVFELFKIDPFLLVHVLPAMASQLEASDLDLRKKAVHLFGKIFCEVDSEAFLEENERVLAAFLRRISDVNADIRLSMIRFAGFGLNNHTFTVPQKLYAKKGRRSRRQHGQDDDGEEANASGSDIEVDDQDDNEGNVSDEEESQAAEILSDEYSPVEEGVSSKRNWWIKHFVMPDFVRHYAKTISEMPEKVTDEPSFIEIALDDKDAEVRREAVEVLLDFINVHDGIRSLMNLKAGSHIFRAVAVRLTDKKIDIALAVLEGLLKCFFSQLVEQCWAKRVKQVFEDIGSSGLNDINPSAATLIGPNESDDYTRVEKFCTTALDWIPDEVVKHQYTNRPNDELLMYNSLLCETFASSISTCIRRSDLSESQTKILRALILSRLWERLSESGKRGFVRIFVEQRVKVQESLSRVVDLHAVSQKAAKASRRSLFSSSQEKPRRSTRGSLGSSPDESVSTGADVDNAEQAGKGLLEKLALEFIPAIRCPNSVSTLRELWNIRDGFVFRDLKTISDPNSSPAEVSKAMEDCVKRVGSKTESSRILRILFSRVSPELASRDIFLVLLSSVLKFQIRTGQMESLSATCELVIDLLKHTPRLARSDTGLLADIVLGILRLVAGSEDTENQSGKGRRRSGRHQTSTRTSSSSSTEVLSPKVDGKAPVYKMISVVIRRSCEGLNAEMAESVPEELASLLSAAVLSSENVLCVRACCEAWCEILKVFSELDLAKSREMFADMANSLKNEVFVLAETKQKVTNRQVSALGALSVLIKHCSTSYYELLEPEEIAKVSFKAVKRPYPTSSESEDEEIGLKVEGISIVENEILRLVKSKKISNAEKTAVQTNLLLLRKLVADGGDPWSGEKKRIRRRSASVGSGSGSESGRSEEDEQSGNEESSTKGRQVKSREKALGLQPKNWPPSEEKKYVLLRKAAGCALIRIDAECPRELREVLLEGKSEKDQELRQIQRWIELSWLALDPSVVVRDALINEIFKRFVKKGREMFRYGSFFVLACSLLDSGKTKSDSSYRNLNQLLGFLHREFERRKGFPKLKETAMAFAPENMMSTVVYLLSHHPMLEGDEDSSGEVLISVGGQKAVVKPLVTLLDGLANLSKNHNVKAGVLYLLLNSIRHHEDVLNPSSEKTHMLSEIAQLLIKSRAKVSPDSLESQGQVTLPMMFQAPVDQSAQVSSYSPMSPEAGQRSSTPRTSRKRTSSGARNPGWKARGEMKSVLPKGFELRVGISGPTQNTGSNTAAISSTRGAATPNKGGKNKRAKRQSRSPGPTMEEEDDEEVTRKLPTPSPSRRQPSRRTKANTNGFSGYMEVDSDVDEMSE